MKSTEARRLSRVTHAFGARARPLSKKTFSAREHFGSDFPPPRASRGRASITPRPPAAAHRPRHDDRNRSRHPPPRVHDQTPRADVREHDVRGERRGVRSRARRRRARADASPRRSLSSREGKEGAGEDQAFVRGRHEESVAARVPRRRRGLRRRRRAGATTDVTIVLRVASIRSC